MFQIVYDYIGRFKSKLKIIERLVNSSSTPEEYLLNDGVYPSILRAQNFLKNHGLSRVFKAQLFNHKSKLFFQDKYVGFIIEFRHTTDLLFNELLNYGFPENTCLNIFFQHTEKNRRVFFTAIVPEDKKSRITQKTLESIAQKIINLPDATVCSARVVEPQELLALLNQVVNGTEECQYDSEFYIGQQVEDYENQIDNDGAIYLNGIQHAVFYTKQYPNVRSNPLNPFIQLINDVNDVNDKEQPIELNFYYAVNIQLKNISAQKRENPDKINTPLLFNSTFILQNSDGETSPADLQEYFRYNIDWLIFQNRNSSLQQFINSLPLQCDNAMFELLENSSINQKFPLFKIAQILPVFNIGE